MSGRFLPRPDGGRSHLRDEGRSAGPPLLCLAGLTRHGADFDPVAARLAASRRVLRVDLRGRGLSDPGPVETYAPAVEAQDVLAALDALGVARVVALGTSRGALVAMAMAAMRPGLIAASALNDVGPVVDLDGIRRILAAMRATPDGWPDWAAAAAAARGAFASAYPDFGPAEWEVFARRLHLERDGRPVRAWDAGLTDATAAAVAAIEADGPPDLWPLFDGLAAQGPTLVLRGARSDVLSAETAAAMAARAPDVRVVVVPDRGHAPTLEEPAAVAALDALLAEPAACA